MSPETVTERLKSSCRGPDNVIMGGWQDGTLVGLVGLRREQQAKIRHWTKIWGMWVASEARGNGVARLLLDGIIQEARGMPGVACIGLTVVTTQAAARSLYRSAGFVTWGLEPNALKLGNQTWEEEHMVLML